jgi:hypothetical protein
LASDDEKGKRAKTNSMNTRDRERSAMIAVVVLTAVEQWLLILTIKCMMNNSHHVGSV